MFISIIFVEIQLYHIYEKKDVANYSAKEELYSAKPGTFFIFFPSDAHKPNITTGGNKPDKKIVIKVKAATK